MKNITEKQYQTIDFCPTIEFLSTDNINTFYNINY